MKLNLKMLAVSAALLGLLAAGAALPASAAGPLNAAAALSLPWSAVAVESVETGTYASTMTVGTQQQLSPVILPAKAARKATVTFMSNDSTIVNVTSEGVAQAVGVGTAQVIASADGVSCVYTITTELDESMIVKEMDITLASGTIAVGETTSLSLGVLPSSASNYANVSLSSSDPAVATVNNFGKVTGVAPGTATITATCGDVSASATVKVVNSGADRQSIDLNTSYVVLKPGASRTITGKVTPSSASQSLTFKSNDTKVATVSAKGVITAVGTGATSIVVSNGTASASVTVIVNRNASSSGNGGGSTDDSNGEVITDPVVEAIEADGTDEVTFAQRELPTITGEMLNALRLNGKTLVVEADNYTIRIAGRDVKNTSAQVSTALSFAPSEYGVTFTLNGGEALPGVVQVEMTGDNAVYTRVYLHNALKGKWQFLNSYKDHVLEADTAGEYLLTTQNLRFAHVDMTFFIAGLVVIVGNCLGKVPEAVPKVPLLIDVERQQKRLRVPFTAEIKEMTLDLRKETDLERSLFFHRLALLDIDWAKPETAGGKGTFKEKWSLYHRPEQIVCIIERAVWGNTVEEAVQKYVSDRMTGITRIPELTGLLDRVIPANLPELVEAMTIRLDRLSAASTDIVEMMEAVPDLVNIVRYGDVRNLDFSKVGNMLRAMVARILAGGLLVCINIDEEAAGELLEHLSATNYAVSTLDDEELNGMWYGFVQQIRNSSGAHPLLSGYAARILYDKGRISREEMRDTLSFYSSVGNAPSDIAYWFEGFLRASGSVLLLDDNLWQLVNGWLCGLSDANFIELLPVIRRTFSNFTTAERRKLGEKAKGFELNGTDTGIASGEHSCNDGDASKVIPLLGRLLGIG